MKNFLLSVLMSSMLVSQVCANLLDSDSLAKGLCIGGVISLVSYAATAQSEAFNSKKEDRAVVDENAASVVTSYVVLASVAGAALSLVANGVCSEKLLNSSSGKRISYKLGWGCLGAALTSTAVAVGGYGLSELKKKCSC